MIITSVDGLISASFNNSPLNFYHSKKIFCVTSGFFGAALNGNFQESKKQAIEMAEDDVEGFGYFQYRHETEPRDPEMAWLTLAGNYIFAEVRCIPALQNMAHRRSDQQV